MVSLRDVAHRAGVSLSTASRVLSGSDYPVTAELRTRIEKAAGDLDYIPNAQARGLLHGNAHTVGVLAGDVGDPYFSEIINGIQSVASEHRLLVTICNTTRDVDRELEYFRLLHSHRTGAVIIAGSDLVDERYHAGLRSRIRSFQRAGGRVVAIGHPRLRVDRVLVDNKAGARRLGRHLRTLGHREIGVLAGLAAVASTVDRVEGLRAAVAAGGGVLRVRHGSPTREGGYAGTAELLAAHPGITALVGTADQMAAGALAYLRECRVPVPQAVSVAGFNDITLARDLTPPLTTVRLPLEAIGATAMDLVVQPDTSGRPRTRRLGTELVVRGTTAPAAGPDGTRPGRGRSTPQKARSSVPLRPST